MRRFFKFLFAATVTFVASAPQQMVLATDKYIAPQFDLYVTHNKFFRSHFVASGNWLTSKGAFASAWGEYDLDIGLVSFFRRYVFKDPDAEKSKRVTFRLGYLQVSDLKDDPNGFDEHRPLAEITVRQPLGRAWLVDDRNRIECRYFHNDESKRYRNRLRIERATTIRKFRMIPYSTGEFFYDGAVNRWNEFQGALGVEFPSPKGTVLQFETMAQIVDGDYSSLSFGFTFQKHI